MTLTKNLSAEAYIHLLRKENEALIKLNAILRSKVAALQTELSTLRKEPPQP